MQCGCICNDAHHLVCVFSSTRDPHTPATTRLGNFQCYCNQKRGYVIYNPKDKSLTKLDSAKWGDCVKKENNVNLEPESGARVIEANVGLGLVLPFLLVRVLSS